MRSSLFFLLLCLLKCGAASQETSCHFESKHYEMRAPFGNCTEWIGKGRAVLWIRAYMTEDKTNEALSHVKSITGFHTIGFLNVAAKHLKFANLESINTTMSALQIINGPNLESVSFPKLRALPVDNLYIRRVPVLSVAIIEELILLADRPNVEFDAECKKLSYIKDTWILPDSCRLMHSLTFAKGIQGCFSTSINYIHGELNIVDTELRGLEFLKLAPLKEKLDKPCRITGNRLSYNTVMAKVIAMVDQVYKNCTISDNRMTWEEEDTSHESVARIA